MAALDLYDLAAESVVVTRAMLVAGMLVGITGEHDPVPTQEQLDRAADLIMRSGRARRQAGQRLLAVVSTGPESL